MKRQFKAPEKIQLSDEGIVNLSDTEFRTRVIRMLQELTLQEHKKDPGSNEGEMKEHLQRANSGRKETRTEIMVWSRRKKETLNHSRMKKQEFKKVRRLRNLQNIFKHSNI